MVTSRREELWEVVEDTDRIVLDKRGFTMFDFTCVSNLLFVSNAP